MPFLPVLLVGLLAAFTQSLSGFGIALVAMAFLPDLLGIQTAAPLVAAMALVVELVLLARYHAALRLRAIWQVAAASVVGIPVGLVALKNLDENVSLTLLGLVITGYAVYNLLGLQPPQLKHPAWAWSVGLLAGMLGGAYNTSGPPVILFANARKWPPAEFKGNLQGFFLLNSILVTAGHLLNGGFTPLVVQSCLWSLPGLLVGMVAGVSLDHVIQPEVFRKLVLLLLVMMGLRLIF